MKKISNFVSIILIIKSGKFKVVKVSNSSELKKGDILLKPKKAGQSGHAAMVLE